MTIRREIGDRAGEGVTLNNISQIYDARGEYDTALDYLKLSLTIRREIGDRAGMCATTINIGHIYWNKNDQKKAMSTWAEAYQLSKSIGYAQALAALDGLAKQLGGNGLEFWERMGGLSGF
jgi:tetratricopeptide (TPR) repeat protein